MYVTYGMLKGDKVSFTQPIKSETRCQAARERNKLLLSGDCVKALTYYGHRLFAQDKFAPVS